jgi:hypothetical protein
MRKSVLVPHDTDTTESGDPVWVKDEETYNDEGDKMQVFIGKVLV